MFLHLQPCPHFPYATHFRSTALLSPHVFCRYQRSHCHQTPPATPRNNPAGRVCHHHVRHPCERILQQPVFRYRSEEHTSELQSRENLVYRLLLEKKKRYSEV